MAVCIPFSRNTKEAIKMLWAYCLCFQRFILNVAHTNGSNGQIPVTSLLPIYGIRSTTVCVRLDSHHRVLIQRLISCLLLGSYLVNLRYVCKRIFFSFVELIKFSWLPDFWFLRIFWSIYLSQEQNVSF